MTTPITDPGTAMPEPGGVTALVERVLLSDKDGGDGRSLAFTPLSVPVVARGNTVTNVESTGPDAAGGTAVARRTWTYIEKAGGAA
ncbi:hypothetical protein [Kitasatospora sp. NPDC059160]|uniref:hypothetical protein n=1 Tax=Kitasatospora sp. NPDC059160 TaxID=3346748 RepID=UPI00368E0D6A